MKPTDFFAKLTSRYLWGNLLAMAVVTAVAALGVRIGLDIYTHHGESIPIPDVRRKAYDTARQMLDNLGLEVVVSDTGYVKSLPPGCILAQSPESGVQVKSGHVVYLTVNATHSPSITLPDVVDNSSLREAMARLTAIGFRLGQPEYIPGEKDWVYGILADGRHVSAGDRIPVDATLVIQVGNGQRAAGDDVDITDAVDGSGVITDEGGDVDEFEVVSAPPADDHPADDGERHNAE